jgi:hypothetical protein
MIQAYPFAVLTVRYCRSQNGYCAVPARVTIKAMMIEDEEIGGVNDSRNTATSADCIRQLPSISKNYTNVKALSLKAEFSKEVCDLATPKDDPVYLELVAKYIGAVLYDNETRASQKLYRIVAVQYVQSYTIGRASCWWLP